MCKCCERQRRSASSNNEKESRKKKTIVDDNIFIRLLVCSLTRSFTYLLTDWLTDLFELSSYFARYSAFSVLFLRNSFVSNHFFLFFFF